MRDFLVHSNRGNVGVAIVEIKRGQTPRGAALDGTASLCPPWLDPNSLDPRPTASLAVQTGFVVHGYILGRG
jgi:hypothetical protein